LANIVGNELEQPPQSPEGSPLNPPKGEADCVLMDLANKDIRFRTLNYQINSLSNFQIALFLFLKTAPLQLPLSSQKNYIN
jgi:hypothetical protein